MTWLRFGLKSRVAPSMWGRLLPARLHFSKTPLASTQKFRCKRTARACDETREWKFIGLGEPVITQGAFFRDIIYLVKVICDK